MLSRRPLGKTGESVSILGLGGFHLLEASMPEVHRLVGRLLDAGGNYFETARQYGLGESEMKLGLALRGHRDAVFLATKVHQRSRAEAERSIDDSLRALGTDHVDLLFLHEVSSFELLDQVTSAGGALAAVLAARHAGKTRFIGMSMHGWPDTLLAALDRMPLDVVMHTLNYFDRCNQPASERVLLPRCVERGIGIVGMKAFADGYLYRSTEPALRYALSLPIATMVVGANTMEMLETDLSIAERFTPMSESEVKALLREAPELGTYVCRQCNECLPEPPDMPALEIFALEGLYDRQMDDGVIPDSPHYALRERLRFWYGLQDEARTAYQALNVDPGRFAECASMEQRCPYGVPIVRKLERAHCKLSGTVDLRLPQYLQ